MCVLLGGEGSSKQTGWDDDCCFGICIGIGIGFSIGVGVGIGTGVGIIMYCSSNLGIPYTTVSREM